MTAREKHGSKTEELPRRLRTTNSAAKNWARQQTMKPQQNTAGSPEQILLQRTYPYHQTHADSFPQTQHARWYSATHEQPKKTRSWMSSPTTSLNPGKTSDKYDTSDE